MVRQLDFAGSRKQANKIPDFAGSSFGVPDVFLPADVEAVLGAEILQVACLVSRRRSNCDTAGYH
jgi:hypothetical protein